MKAKFMPKAMAALAFLCALGCAGQNKENQVFMYLPDSYDWLSPPLEAFAQEQGIALNAQTVQGAGSMYSRLALERAAPRAAVAAGFNESMRQQAASFIVDSALFDYGYLAVLTNDGSRVADFAQLADEAGRFALYNPIHSSTGRDFFLWTVKALGEGGWQEFWRKAKRNNKVLASSWSEAFGLYTQGQVQGVISYSTDNAFTQHTEGKSYSTVNALKEGWFKQNEYVVLLKEEDNARKIYNFLLSPPAQSLIPLNNWMYPALASIQLPEVFTRYAPAIDSQKAYSAEGLDAQSLLAQWEAVWNEEP